MKKRKRERRILKARQASQDRQRSLLEQSRRLALLALQLAHQPEPQEIYPPNPPM